MLDSGVEEYRPTPTLRAEEQAAWELYCAETAGDMHVVDFWHQLSPRVKAFYLNRVRK